MKEKERRWRKESREGETKEKGKKRGGEEEERRKRRDDKGKG